MYGGDGRKGGRGSRGQGQGRQQQQPQPQPGGSRQKAKAQPQEVPSRKPRRERRRPGASPGDADSGPPASATSTASAAARRRLSDLLAAEAGTGTLAQEDCDGALGTCVAADEWDLVLEVLAAMGRCGLGQERSTYRTCLDRCAEAGNGRSAHEILGAMAGAGIDPDPADQALVVRTLCRSGLWRRAKGLLLGLEDAAPPGKAGEGGGDGENDDSDDDEGAAGGDRLVAVDAYNAVLVGMKGEGLWKEAVQLLDTMERGHVKEKKPKEGGAPPPPSLLPPPRAHPSPNLVTYHHVLEVCASSRQAEQALRLLTDMPAKGVPPTQHSFDVVVRGLLKKNQWRRALGLLDLMDERGVEGSTRIYNTVISACSRAREVGAAMSIYTKMKKVGIRPDVVTFNALMSACAGAGRYRDAMSLLQQCQREPGVDPDIITYTNAMRASSRARRFKDALELFEVAKDMKLKPDVYCYTTAIDACAKGKMWRKAMDLLDDMRRNDVSPSEVTYSVAIAACGNGGQWQRAMELLNQMRDRGMPINVITYSSAISALAKGARRSVRDGDGAVPEELYVRALELLDTMAGEGVEPDAYSYSAAMSACASAGRWEEALRLIARMRKAGPRTQPNKITYTAAISACGRAGQWEHALRLFDEMRNDGLQPDRISYNSIITALRIGSQPERAYEVWGEMCGRKAVADDNEGEDSKTPAKARADSRQISPDIITLTDVMTTLDRSGGAKFRARMDKVFEEAVDRGIVLPADSLDSLFEVDLSGMSISVAHAACRYVVRRTKEAITSGEASCDDLVFITGVGKAKQQQHEGGQHQSTAKQEQNEDAGVQSGAGGNSGTALREYVRQVLRDDFDPPLYTTVPAFAQGSVRIAKKALQEWIRTSK